jgi:hypothetical protein
MALNGFYRDGPTLRSRDNLVVALPDPAGTLPKACNAGLVDIESAIEDLTESEVQLGLAERGASRSEGPACLRQGFGKAGYKPSPVSPPGLLEALFFNVKDKTCLTSRPETLRKDFSG